MATAEEVVSDRPVEYPLAVHYCGNCTMPLEYCEYGGELKKCREWLKDNLPDVYEEMQGKLDHLNFWEFNFTSCSVKRRRVL